MKNRNVGELSCSICGRPAQFLRFGDILQVFRPDDIEPILRVYAVELGLNLEEIIGIINVRTGRLDSLDVIEFILSLENKGFDGDSIEFVRIFLATLIFA